MFVLPSKHWPPPRGDDAFVFEVSLKQLAVFQLASLLNHCL